MDPLADHPLANKPPVALVARMATRDLSPAPSGAPTAAGGAGSSPALALKALLELQAARQIKSNHHMGPSKANVQVLHLTASANGKWLAVLASESSREEVLEVWDYDAGRVVLTYDSTRGVKCGTVAAAGPMGKVAAAAFVGHTSEQLALVTDQKVAVVQVDCAHAVVSQDKHDIKNPTAAIAVAGDRIFVGTTNGHVRVASFERVNEAVAAIQVTPATATPHRGAVVACVSVPALANAHGSGGAISPAVVSGAADGSLAAWDAEMPNRGVGAFIAKAHDGGVLTVVVAQGGRLVATAGSHDRTVAIWVRMAARAGSMAQDLQELRRMGKVLPKALSIATLVAVDDTMAIPGTLVAWDTSGALYACPHPLEAATHAGGGADKGKERWLLVADCAPALAATHSRISPGKAKRMQVTAAVAHPVGAWRRAGGSKFFVATAGIVTAFAVKERAAPIAVCGAPGSRQELHVVYHANGGLNTMSAIGKDCTARRARVADVAVPPDATCDEPLTLSASPGGRFVVLAWPRCGVVRVYAAGGLGTTWQVILEVPGCAAVFSRNGPAPLLAVAKQAASTKSPEKRRGIFGGGGGPKEVGMQAGFVVESWRCGAGNSNETNLVGPLVVGSAHSARLELASGPVLGLATDAGLHFVSWNGDTNLGAASVSCPAGPLAERALWDATGSMLALLYRAKTVVLRRTAAGALVGYADVVVPHAFSAIWHSNQLLLGHPGGVLCVLLGGIDERGAPAVRADLTLYSRIPHPVNRPDDVPEEPTKFAHMSATAHYMLAGVRGGLLFGISVPSGGAMNVHPSAVSHAVRADVLLRCATAQGLAPAPLVSPMLLDSTEGGTMRLACPAGGAAASLSFAAACGGSGTLGKTIAQATDAPLSLVVHAASLDARSSNIEAGERDEARRVLGTALGAAAEGRTLVGASHDAVSADAVAALASNPFVLASRSAELAHACSTLLSS